jgi:hypothetical protein
MIVRVGCLNKDFLRLKDEQDDELARLFYPVYPKIL